MFFSVEIREGSFFIIQSGLKADQGLLNVEGDGVEPGLGPGHDGLAADRLVLPH